MIDFVTLQRALDEWPEETDLLDTHAPRVASALRQATRSACGPGDLAVVVRDALRGWQEQRGSNDLPAPLRVPASAPWPKREEWAACGIAAAPGRGTAELRLTDVRPWRPAWLPFAEPVDAFPASRAERWRREPVAADPVWRFATGHDEYRSYEQREAVRTLVTAPPDATVLVVLATGSGKSLVGLLHALTAGQGSTTVVVVPTTSLAIDQEEQLRVVLRRKEAPDADAPFAWHAGLSPPVRAEVLGAIRDGRQRAVFTSPEALFGALGEVLLETAQAGRLGQFVVDEAHMVATWGTDFRPDFQALAGYRHQLRDAAAEHEHRFRTVLMSATVTQADVATLGNLFTDERRRLVVAGAPSLRPEIAYLTAESQDRESRLQRVREAVLHLPRPLFVYATRKRDVAELEQAFRESGISRLVTVTGDSSDDDRRHAVKALRGEAGRAPTADLAVGTSAFGLGIDVPAVRAVVHACLPETIDRYYQEVGRSARDGRAALGLLLWTRSDQDIAHGLSEQRVIGVPLARERWAAMRRAAHYAGETTWVPLRALRIGLHEETDENENWNSRTLASMARAGFIGLMGSRREQGATSIGVRLRRSDLGSATAWEAFEAMRGRVREASRRSLERVVALARDGRVCEALVPVYTAQDPERLTADLVVHDTCGGCASCFPPRPVPVAPLPVDRPEPEPAVPAAIDGLQRQEQGVTFAVADDESRWRRDVGRLVAAASHGGIRQLVGEPQSLQLTTVQRALDEAVSSSGSKAPLVTEISPPPGGDDGLETLPLVPTLLLLDPHGIRSDLFAIVRRLPRPLIAVVSTRQPSTIREDMTMRQMHPSIPGLSEIIDKLEAWRT